MTIETDIDALLGPLVNGQISPDIVPDNRAFPLIVYQFISGNALWFLGRKMPSHRHVRLQVTVWSSRRLEANTIAREVETKICESNLIAQPYGSFTALFEEAIKKYGTRQDFGIWYPDP